MWKVIIHFLKCKKSDYIKSVKIGKRIYVIRIEKYKSPAELAEDLQGKINHLKVETHQGR